MKFHIKDEDGKDYTVEEIIEKETQDEDIKEKTETVEKIELSDEEIKALKSLAAVSDKLIALVSEQTTDEDTTEEVEEDEDEDEDIIEDEDENEDMKETVITTKSCDSKKSFGSLEKSKKVIDDSLADDISAKWQERYKRSEKNGSNY